MTEHYHAKANGNYPCGVINNINPLHRVEELLAWEDDFSEEEIENSRLHLEAERNNHAALFFLWGAQLKKKMDKQSSRSTNMKKKKMNLMKVHMCIIVSCL